MRSNELIVLYQIVGRKEGQKDVELFRAHQEEICTVTLPVLMDIYKDGKTFDAIVLTRERTQEEMDQLKTNNIYPK